MWRFVILAAVIVAGHCPAAWAQMAWPDAQYRAENPPLTTEELKAVYHGQTHSGVYEISRRSVATFAYEETTFADGRVLHLHGDKTDHGTWRIKGGRICFTYEDPELVPACFEVYKLGNCYYNYQKTARGYPYEGWTGWSVIKGEDPTCVNIVA